MVGMCIFDDEAVCAAAKQEILRRWYAAQCEKRKGTGSETALEKCELLMKQTKLTVADRPVVSAALERSEATGGAPAAALELPDGRIVTGKTSPLLGASAATLLNALKALAGIAKEVPLMSPAVIEPIQELKVEYLGNHNPRLHTDEILVALSICAATDPNAKKAMDCLSQLKNCQAHSTVILAPVDDSVWRKLGVHITCEPRYQSKKLFHY
jgi:uncharacterized protein (UPF0371 family)